MKVIKKLHFLQLLLLLMNTLSISVKIRTNYCGSTRIEAPFSHQNSSLLNQMILCRSNNLYFRTSIGLFPISSIDYKHKLLIISHTSCSSSSHFLSPHLLSSGFPPLSWPNSLLLMNCSNPSLKGSKLSFFPCNNNTQLSGLSCDSSSCLLIHDVEKLDKVFHPKQLNCTHYSRVYRNSEKFEVGSRVSFDIPDHVPNPCKECGKPDGNCGAGLRCVCHPIKCKDKVISVGTVVKPCGNMLVCLVFFLFMMGFLHGF